MGFRREPNFSSYQENLQERDSGGRGVSNASLFTSIRAISLPLDAVSVLVSVNGLDDNQKRTANGYEETKRTALRCRKRRPAPQKSPGTHFQERSAIHSKDLLLLLLSALLKGKGKVFPLQARCGPEGV